MVHHGIIEAADLYFVPDAPLDPLRQLATRHAPCINAEHQPASGT
jgi:hypothetical protein